MNSSLNSTSIKALRCRMGWCRSELALRLGVSSTTVHEWEADESRPTFAQAALLDHLFRQSETSVLEILQSPVAETLLDSMVLESVNMRDLVRDRKF